MNFDQNRDYVPLRRIKVKKIFWSKFQLLNKYVKLLYKKGSMNNFFWFIHKIALGTGLHLGRVHVNCIIFGIVNKAR